VFCENNLSILDEKYKRETANAKKFHGFHRLYQNTADALTGSAKCGIICSQQKNIHSKRL
jgi:hypothetical protein